MSFFSFLNTKKDAANENAHPGATSPEDLGSTPNVSYSIESKDSSELFESSINVSSVDSISDNKQSITSSSGFSFMSNKNSSEIPSAEMPISTSTSSFSFLSSPSSSVVMSSSNIEAVKEESSSQTIVLTKTATTRQVKKKKKGALVGFARDDGDDEIEAPVLQDSIPNISFQLNVQKSHEIAPSEPELPPPSSIIDSHESPSIDLVVNNNDSLRSDAIVPDNTSSSTEEENTIPIKDISVLSQDTSMLTTISPVETTKKENRYDEALRISVEEAKSLSPSNKLIQEAKTIFDPLIEMTLRSVESLHLNNAKLLDVNRNIEMEEKRIFENKAKLVDAEAEQQQYAIEEDFDKADSMNLVIESIKNDIIKGNNVLHELKALLLFVESQPHTIRDKYKALALDTITKISSIANEYDEESLELEADAKHRQEIVQIRLKSEEERLAIEIRHIEKEEESLNQEKVNVEESINTQSGDIMQNKAILEIQLSTISNEIQDLEQLLKMKKSEESKLIQDLQDIDIKVSSVRKRYEKQLNRIHDRQELLSKTKYECFDEETNYKKELALYESDVVNSTLERDSFVSFQNLLLLESSALKILSETIEEIEKSKVSCLTDSSKEYEDFKTKLAIAETELLTVIGNKTSITNEIHVLTQELNDLIEETLPKLENEKKSHASAKRFKEASVVAKELKSLSSKKEEMEENVTSLNENLQKTLQDLLAAEAKVTTAQKNFNEIQRDSDFKKYELLKTQNQSLDSAKLSISNLTKSSTDNFSHDCIEAIISYIDTEIEIVSGVISEIKNKHSISEEEPMKESIHNDSVFSSDTSEVLEIAGSADNLNSNDDVVTKLQSLSSTDFVIEASEDLELESIVNEAKELISSIESHNIELQDASESEDFDKAAELNDKILSLEDRLQTLLQLMSCTKEDLLQM